MFIPPDSSSLQLSQVVAETARLVKDPGDLTPAVCEHLGRAMLAMYREQAHPARMFHLVSQVADSLDPDVGLLLPIAWSTAEGGSASLKVTSGEVN